VRNPTKVRRMAAIHPQILSYPLRSVTGELQNAAQSRSSGSNDASIVPPAISSCESGSPPMATSSRYGTSPILRSGANACARFDKSRRHSGDDATVAGRRVNRRPATGHLGRGSPHSTVIAISRRQSCGVAMMQCLADWQYESPWDLWRLSVLDMKESNEFTQGFESAAVFAG